MTATRATMARVGGRRWAAVLLTVAFSDELATGVIPAGSPELQQTFDLSPAGAAGWTLFAFGALAIVLEPPLLALAHGRRERRFRVAGLAMMAATMIAAALAPTYALLLVALTLYGPASGLGTQLSEAALVSAAPERGEKTLARWSLLGAVGDLLAPVILAVSVALGFGWRGALVAVGAMVAAQALVSARAPASTDGAEDESGMSLREAFRVTARSPKLLGWSLAAVLCGLMDEVLVAFGALSMAERLGADATVRAWILTAWVAGAILGTVVLERISGRLRSSTLLWMSGLGSVIAYALWLTTTHWISSAVTLAIAGLFSAMHYPLLRAQAFAAMPNRPNLVVAAASVFGPIDLALPVLVGWVANAFGLFAALLLLLLQPFGVLLSALAARRAERTRR